MNTAAYHAIQKELVNAKVKFPRWPNDPLHAAAIVAEEAGELVQAALQFNYEKGTATAMFDEAVQVGAMAVRFIENMLEYGKTQNQGVTGSLQVQGRDHAVLEGVDYTLEYIDADTIRLTRCR